MRVDPELREFARSGATSTRSVLLEVVAMPVAVPAHIARSSERRGAATRNAHALSEDSVLRSVKTAVGSLLDELSKLHLASDPVVLMHAGTVVVELTADQLERVMTLPMVAVIRPNRTLQVPERSQR